MKPEDEREIELTRDAMLRLSVKHPRLRGDDLLNAATKLAGYDVGTTRVEQCAQCGELYHADYGGEYIDPFDHEDILAELREDFGINIRSLRRLYYAHFCDFQCLMGAVRSGRRIYRGPA